MITLFLLVSTFPYVKSNIWDTYYAFQILPKGNKNILYIILLIRGDASYLQNIIEEEKHCEATLIHKDFFPSGYGIAMPLGSPYKPFFDDA